MPGISLVLFDIGDVTVSLLVSIDNSVIEVILHRFSPRFRNRCISEWSGKIKGWWMTSPLHIPFCFKLKKKMLLLCSEISKYSTQPHWYGEWNYVSRWDFNVNVLLRAGGGL